MDDVRQKENQQAATSPAGESLRELVRQAFALRDQGRLDEIPLLLARTSEHLEDMAAAFKNLSELFDLTGEAYQAEKLKRAYEALVPLEREIDSAAGEARLRIDEEDRAASPVPTETLAGLYYRQGHLEEALEVYKQMLDLDPTNPRLVQRADDLREEIALAGRTPASLPPEAEPQPEQARDAAKLRLIGKLERLAAAARRRREVLPAA